jgi:hypothetical protein
MRRMALSFPEVVTGNPAALHARELDAR